MINLTQAWLFGVFWSMIFCEVLHIALRQCILGELLIMMT